MNRRLLAEQWEDFNRRVIPPDAGPIQRQEMRRAFYAGAEGILFRVIAAFAPEADPTPQDLQIMEDVHDEMKQFAADVAAGRA